MSFSCLDCNLEFVHPTKLKLHVDEKHKPTENKIICEVCTKTFDKIETLTNQNGGCITETENL